METLALEKDNVPYWKGLRADIVLFGT